MEGGLLLPLLPTACTRTEYWVAGVRPLKVQWGEALVHVTLVLPPTTVAVKVYEAQGPPVDGGVASAEAAVGPVASTLVRVGALREGMTRVAAAEEGRRVPSANSAEAVRV